MMMGPCSPLRALPLLVASVVRFALCRRLPLYEHLARSCLESLAARRRLWGGEMGLCLVGAATATICLCASPRSAMPSTKAMGADAAHRLPWPETKSLLS
ncbi:hypothetical protein ACLOJK_034889 [Asimina triloba]